MITLHVYYRRQRIGVKHLWYIYYAISGPPIDAVRIICSKELPMTTKMKNPSITGPTANPFFFPKDAEISTAPRL